MVARNMIKNILGALVAVLTRPCTCRVAPPKPTRRSSRLPGGWTKIGRGRSMTGDRIDQIHISTGSYTVPNRHS
jgi:hypothetical protein